jgi:IS1 transposase
VAAGAPRDLAYLEGVYAGFGTDVDYAMLVKLYGPAPTGPEARYSPPMCSGARAEVKCGDPDPEHISTSYAERQNLNMRMGMRRFTRLTNAFSKKVENHEHMIAMYYAFYNFARVHQTLKTTPSGLLLRLLLRPQWLGGSLWQP